jgi:hypothetical protein
MTHGETATSTARGTDGAGRGLAVLMVLGGALLAIPFGSAAIGLVREQLHIRCGMGPPDSEGADTWTCSDGIGYLGVAVTLGGMWFLALALGSLLAGVVRHRRAARIGLVLLAIGATAWVLGWTWYGSSRLVDDAYSPMKGTEYWTAAVGPAALVSAVALGAALVSLLFTGRAPRIICAGAAIGLVIATALQPGLGVITLPAAGLLAAASVRATGGHAQRRISPSRGTPR